MIQEQNELIRQSVKIALETYKNVKNIIDQKGSFT